MLNLQSDELIHSFIFRAHLVYGIDRFDNIISKDGRWSCFPRLAKYTFHHFKSVCEKEIHDSLISIGVQAKYVSPTDDASTRYGYLKYFYGLTTSTYSQLHRCLPIRFCLDCMRLSLYNNGFGYFRSSWYWGESCTTHHQLLQTINTDSRNDTLDHIHALLRGEHDESTRSQKHINVETTQPKKTALPIIAKNKTPNAYFAPCSIRITMMFVIINSRQIPESILRFNQLKTIVTGLADKKRKYGIPFLPLHRLLLRDNLFNYKELWESSIQHTQVDCGVFTKGNLIETIIKDKYLECSHCDLDCRYGSMLINSEQTTD